MKKYSVFFIDEKTKHSYTELKNGTDSERRLYRYITRAIEDLSNNPFTGLRLNKNLIPKEYKKYDIERVLKYDLPKGWRLIYTLANEDIQIYSVIIEWFNHKNYEKRFNYIV